VGVVMIRCPGTGRAISTGIEADRRSFSAAPVFFSRTLCPLCRIQHEWFARDAWVGEKPRHEPDRLRLRFAARGG
jgi:hypothetical protein